MPAPCCRQTAGRPEDLLGNHMTAACDGSPESAPLNQLDAAHDRLEDAVNLEPIAQAASTLARVGQRSRPAYSETPAPRQPLKDLTTGGSRP